MPLFKVNSCFIFCFNPVFSLYLDSVQLCSNLAFLL
uniref:Uncharacterized protein n=1 Tax=Anguilla anguilla TaxID=7936 RepID=A0A0E9PH93_ANGAN